MCHYCDQNARLTAEHAALYRRLISLPAGAWDEERAIRGQIDTLNRRQAELDDAGEADPAACELWKVTA